MGNAWPGKHGADYLPGRARSIPAADRTDGVDLITRIVARDRRPVETPAEQAVRRESFGPVLPSSEGSREISFFDREISKKFGNAAPSSGYPRFLAPIWAECPLRPTYFIRPLSELVQTRFNPALKEPIVETERWKSDGAAVRFLFRFCFLRESRSRSGTAPGRFDPHSRAEARANTDHLGDVIKGERAG